MKKTKASPTLISRGTQPKRIVLTRGELIKILGRFADFVKNKKAEDFPGFLDEVFDEAARDGAVVFDREAPGGRRFADG